MQNCLRLLRIALALSLTISAALFVAWSWRWPLVGDASLIHYIVFLMRHGMAPYRDISEMSMPGSFLVEMAGMKVFGGGAVGWRVFDFTLLASAAVGFRVLTRHGGWLAAVFAGALFALVHGRDGLAQGGQRDLTMAVMLVLATAALLLAVRSRRGVGAVTLAAGFGLLAGMAATMKPTVLPLVFAQLGLVWWAMRRGRGDESAGPWPLLLAAVAGMVMGPLVALGFLLREGALEAFWGMLHGLLPYYARLGHKSPVFLLVHCVSPLMPLVAIWVVMLVFARPRWTLERGLLVCGAAFGLVSYLLQQRGFPYYRYPLLAFLLPLMGMDFALAMEWVKQQGWRLRAAGGLAIAGLCVGGFFLGPQSAVLIHRYRWWEADFLSTMEANLNRLGGTALSGDVKCIDSVSGCSTVLYRMRLVSARGMTMDFPLFGAAGEPYVQRARAEFRRATMEHPPQVLVVSSALYVDGPGNYEKLERWPELENFLARDYRLDTDWKPSRMQRWWSREEFGPSYRIYVRR